MTAPAELGHSSLRSRIEAINASAAFNRFFGIEVQKVEPGAVEIAMAWRAEAGQYAGFLHAGVICGLIDTACGFAAVTLVGNVLASHCAVNCLRPAVGDRFVAKARVVKPGRSQVFTACELFAHRGNEAKLVATGETLLIVVAGEPAG